MKFLYLLALFFFGAIMRSHALPVKVSKPKALTTSRDDRSVGAVTSATPSKDTTKPPYLIRVVPQEQDEFEKLLDFFAVGGIDSPAESAESPQKNSYGSYEPRQDDLTEPLLPPPVEQNEPNYYAEKPKKTKSKKYMPNQKLVNIKNAENIEKIENEKSRLNSAQGEVDEEYFLDGLDLDKLLASAWLTQADADAEATRTAKDLKQADLNTGEFIPSQQRRMDENTRRLPNENEGARVDFQLHGHKGPTSYAFGYDTGRIGSFT
ncbi:uncharacterized protein LOC131429995 isoform X1 [Malaya genurostris]|uniref:uncharacterized protein LOC131429995 isoform X1 n=1 Tax=Malaya genurostris TaxID=325434 RepID=UPI0026F391C2|nr:uncharacterized protein LOC131429995 isoform X1 [Malaya genurostris]